MSRRPLRGSGAAPVTLLLAASLGAVLMIVCFAEGLGRGKAAGPVETGPAAADPLAAYVAGHGHAVLTFDDGPDPRWTPRVLAVLRAEHAHAIFFVIGEMAARYPALVRQIQAEGNEIGNHTYTHPDPVRISGEELARQIDETNAVVTRETGVRPVLFRPPYGHPTGDLEPILAQRSMRTVLWDDSPSDYLRPAAPALVERVLAGANAGPGTIVLLHDGDAGGADDNRSETCRALAGIISGLRSDGFTLSTDVPPPWTP